MKLAITSAQRWCFEQKSIHNITQQWYPIYGYDKTVDLFISEPASSQLQSFFNNLNDHSYSNINNYTFSHLQYQRNIGQERIVFTKSHMCDAPTMKKNGKKFSKFPHFEKNNAWW